MEGLHELVWILEGNKEVINIDTDIFIAIAGITKPHIRISIGGRESHGPESVSKLFMEPGTGRAKTIEGLPDGKGVSLEGTEFFTSCEGDPFLGVGFKVGVPNIGSREFEAVEFSKESHHADAAKGGDRGVDRVLGRSSEVTTSHEPGLAATGLLAVENKVTLDVDVARRSRVVLAKVFKGGVVIELADLSSDGISPESVAVLFIKSIGLPGIPWDLDAKLVTNSRGFGATAGLVEHALQDFGTAC